MKFDIIVILCIAIRNLWNFYFGLLNENLFRRVNKITTMWMLDFNAQLGKSNGNRGDTGKHGLRTMNKLCNHYTHGFVTILKIKIQHLF